MNVFKLRDHLIKDYHEYIASFIQIRDQRIRDYVHKQLEVGLLWPEALIQLNPTFQTGSWIDQLVDEGLLHRACKQIFRRKSDENPACELLFLHNAAAGAGGVGAVGGGGPHPRSLPRASGHISQERERGAAPAAGEGCKI